MRKIEEAIEERGCLKPLPHAALAALPPGASGDAGAREEPSSQLRGSWHGPTMAIDKESKAPQEHVWLLRQGCRRLQAPA